MVSLGVAAVVGVVHVLLGHLHQALVVGRAALRGGHAHLVALARHPRRHVRGDASDVGDVGVHGAHRTILLSDQGCHRLRRRDQHGVAHPRGVRQHEPEAHPGEDIGRGAWPGSHDFAVGEREGRHGAPAAEDAAPVGGGIGLLGGALGDGRGAREREDEWVLTVLAHLLEHLAIEQPRAVRGGRRGVPARRGVGARGSSGGVIALVAAERAAAEAAVVAPHADERRGPDQAHRLKHGGALGEAVVRVRQLMERHVLVGLGPRAGHQALGVQHEDFLARLHHRDPGAVGDVTRDHLRDARARLPGACEQVRVVAD
mmetsp:Transcript_2847/g.6390  ORF Transcript_2847/g.6390 Transcript_2847/m.6390 type:complete len:315 (-) Transcript_2847:958-1902(-)